MIDLHSHVLPGIDDGPADLAGSIAMAQVAADGGTRWLVATPHLREDYPAVRPEELRARVADLNAALHRRGVELEVLSGAEIDLSAALELSDADLRAASLGGGGRDLLIESPYGPLPPMFESLLATVTARGFRVTLAHPEHNPSFREEPERLASLVASGVLVQVTSGSLRGGRRSGSRRLALIAIETGWAHVLASDAHSSDWRPPTLAADVRELEREEPGLAARLRWMTDDAPRAILAGGALPPAPRVRSNRRRRLLGRLSGHAR
ncbi:MAG TPA: CpsB/CapC family capsule biosynthesis tyrosine phosphatase [Solirubrobacteraceae bacterium]|jgi:protein-tyrosine phosphatase|nr:CpsB/CapC family capsule biosynthesis tyrosine phosphatase [Solirubrobacteraceae bacterium]